MSEFADLLLARLNGIVALSEPEVEALEAHWRLLQRWNRVLNLTAVRNPSEMIERHYCESLFLGAFISPERHTIADIGSGPGFPGFPLAVLYPDSQVSLIESHHRKAVFLREASRAFPNIRVVNTRAEQVAGRFDWIVSRAVSVGPLASTLKRIGQRLALLGGREVAEQLPEIAWAEPIRLPWGQQSFVWLGRTVSRETSLDDERRFT